MLRPYREALTTPGAPAFTAAGLLGRLPISMVALGIVLLVQDDRGSYADAGLVAAVFGITNAVAAPAVAGLVDRHGQRRVMAPAVALHVVGLLALVGVSLAGGALAAYVAAALLAGATIGSLGALVRARWSHALGRSPHLHTAYSWESVLDEVVFIAGPVIVTTLAVVFAPVWGLVAAAAAVGIGATWLLSQHATEPPASGRHGGGGPPVWRSGGMGVVLAVFVLTGVLFGSVEVITVAFTDERGAPGAAGLVLAAFALGSMIAGLGYGAVQWRSPPGRRFVLGAVVLAVGVTPLVLADAVVVLGALLFVAGFAISPTIIAGNALVQYLVPPARLTEGLTWVSTAIGFGFAAGSAGGGAAVEAVGPRSALAIASAAAVLAALMALVGARTLRTPPEAGHGGGVAAAAPGEPAQPGGAAADGASRPSSTSGSVVGASQTKPRQT